MTRLSILLGSGALLLLMTSTALCQPKVTVDVTAPSAPESVQKDINAIQKHRASYERARNLLATPPVTAPSKPTEDPYQSRRDAMMERRNDYKAGQLESQTDRKEKIEEIKKKLVGEAEKIEKAEEERLKKRQQKIAEEAEVEREKKKLAQQKRHNDIMERARKHRKSFAARKREYNERRTLIKSRRNYRPTRSRFPESRNTMETPKAQPTDTSAHNPTLKMTPAPGVDISIGSKDE